MVVQISTQAQTIFQSLHNLGDTECEWQRWSHQQAVAIGEIIPCSLLMQEEWTNTMVVKVRKFFAAEHSCGAGVPQILVG